MPLEFLLKNMGFIVLMSMWVHKNLMEKGRLTFGNLHSENVEDISELASVFFS